MIKITRISKVKHTCDHVLPDGSVCGKTTMINYGTRMFWFHYQDKSLCPSHYDALPEDKRRLVDIGANLVLHMSMGILAISFGDDTESSRKLTPDELEAIEEFNMVRDCPCGSGKTQIKIMVGPGGWN